MQKSVEAYLRNLYAFGPDVQVTVGPLKESSIPGLLATDITVKIEDNVQVGAILCQQRRKIFIAWRTL